jgi:hypothetical protein
LLASPVSGFHLCAAMIRGNIAIPSVDPKTWRSKARRKCRPQPDVPTIIEGVKSPQEIDRKKRGKRIMGEE